MWRWLCPVRRLRLNWAFTNTPWASGGGGFSEGSRRSACWMRCGLAGHARSMTIRLPPSLSASLRSTPTDATHWSIRSMAGVHRIFTHDDPQDLDGVRPAAASLWRPSQAFERSALRRQGPRYCRPLFVAAQPGRWSSVSMRKARFRRSTANSSVLADDAWRAGAPRPTPISVMVLLRYLQRSMSPRVL